MFRRNNGFLDLRFSRRVPATVLMKHLIVLGVLAATALPAAAAVTKLPIPGGEVRDIVYSAASTAYAATRGGGVYRTTDGGLNWSRLGASPARFVNQLAVGSAGTLYAATDTGVYSSADGGSSWVRLFNDRTSAIAVRPGTDDTLVFGVPGAGVYRILAGAAPQWSGDGLGNTGVSAVAFDPVVTTTVYLGVTSPCQDAACSAQEGVGVYRSVDGGGSWSDITGNLDVQFVTGVAVTNDQTVFVSTRRPDGCGIGGVNRLANGAVNWSNPTGETSGMVYGAETVKVDRFDANAVWVGSCGLGLYRGVASGTGWTFSRQHGVGAPPAELLNAAYAIGSFPGSGRVSVGVRGAGVFTSSSARNGPATSWSEASGLHALRATSFDVSPVSAMNFYVGSSGAGVLRSTNSGMTWARFNTGFPGLSGTPVPTLLNFRGIAAHPSDGNKVAAIAVGFGGFPGGVFQANSGVWSQPSGGGSFANPLGLVYPLSDDSILVTNFDNHSLAGLFSGSASAGAFSQKLAEIGYGKVIESRFVPGRIFVLSYGPDTTASPAHAIGVVSQNGGANWGWMVADHSGFMQLTGNVIAERDANWLVASTNKGLFGSSDGGLSWTRISTTGAGTTLFSGLAYLGPDLFAVGRNGGFYCSKDDGVSWSSLESLLPESPVFVGLEARAGKLYLVSDGAGVLAADPTCP